MPQGLLRSFWGPLLAAALLALASAPALRAATPELPCPGNRLVNPGFEQGFAARGLVARTVALGWLAWNESAELQAELLPLSRARGGDDAVQSGAWSQAQRDLGRLQAGGLWQRVEVPAGERIVAHAWGRAWAGPARDRGLAASEGRYVLGIGLDPRGGSDPSAPAIVWTEPVTVTDTWLPLFVETTAEAGAVSLFLRGRPLDAMPNEVRWDAACLRLADEVLPPAATETPLPLPTRAPVDGQPSETPGLPTLEARARAQAAATGRALALDLRATEWAATPPAARQPEGRAGGGASALPPAGLPLNSAGDEARGWTVPLWAKIYDSAGLAALALAALALGLLTGLGRADRGTGP